MKTLKKLCVVCGGTGGHFYPGVSIAQTFKALDSNNDAFLLLSGKHVTSQSDYAAKQGLHSVITPAAQRPKGPISLYIFMKALISGTLKAKKALADFRPDALLAMGSFASLPSVLAAIWLKIPVFLHDGNARLGKANLLLSRFAKYLGAGFPPVNTKTLHCDWEWVGMPVRKELQSPSLNKQEAIERLNQKFSKNFTTKLPTLFIFGGSQGALVFNDIMPQVLSKLPENSIQVIHLTGKDKLAPVTDAYTKIDQPCLILETSPEMSIFYSASDFVISRSGGSTIAELAIFGKYVCLVPYPYAADLHQDDNATFYENSGAGIVIQNKDFNVDTMSKNITSWLKDPSHTINQGLNAQKHAKPNAATDMIELIEANLS